MARPRVGRDHADLNPCRQADTGQMTNSSRSSTGFDYAQSPHSRHPENKPPAAAMGHNPGYGISVTGPAALRGWREPITNAVAITLIHGKSLMVERTLRSNGDAAPPKTNIYRPESQYATIPRSGFVQVGDYRLSRRNCESKTRHETRIPSKGRSWLE
jgi:hypothetical protein